ncbi:3138_t:CDS:2 [Funneliformis geosporum]|uniref:3138_t:CDS:1 n=1 Tax=Funneliformis geosporum TaxID=1117311 RepID=A0A9W4SHY0_9GLOM|nr:3138_t:CDS:2 [Funneliformis geosporum]
MNHESTTGKVIGHLQHEIEHLKKEVADAKTSIHIAKVARERADRQAAEHYASHQTLKLEIDSLKRMLELERDKTNKLLQESESKAVELEKQLAIVIASREQAEFQYKLLSKELQNFKTRYIKDVESIKVDFQDLRNEMVSTSKGLKKTVVEAGSRIETLTKERKCEVENLETIQIKLKENQEKSIASILSEVDRMKKDVEISNQKTQLYSNQVAKVEDEISNKMKWLKNIKIR